MKLPIKQSETFACDLQVIIDNLNSFHEFDLCTNPRKDNNLL